MLTFLIRRLFWTIWVLLGVAILAFLLIHSVPGSPWDRQTGRRAMSNLMVTKNTMATLDRRFGLDRPLGEQFVRYLVGWKGKEGFECGFICGNMGPSMYQQGRTVSEILFEPPEGGTFRESRFGYTLRLAGLAFLFTLAVGLPLGVWSAVRRNTSFDIITSIFTAVGMSMPNFVLGFLVIVVFASTLHLMSVRPDWKSYQGWIIPTVVLAIGPIGMLTRMTRTAVLEAMHGDYVRTARSKGLDEGSILTVHILKNAAIPVLTHLGPVLFELIAASFVIEVMFGFPGFGREYYESVTRLDYSMIMALTLLYGIFVAFANLLTDILYVALDPRVRVS